jgi:translocation and assembly module TamB
MFFTTDGGKDVTVTTDDFLLDQVERTQRQRTRHRRDSRSRRRQLYLLGGLVCFLVLLLVAPSLASHSSIGRSILIQSLARHGLESRVDSMRIGWFTPLKITGLTIHGAAGSNVTIDQLGMDLTVGNLIGTSPDQLGQVTLRGVTVSCKMNEGRCSLEDDFQSFLDPSDGSSTTSALLKLQDISLAVTDVAGGTWQVAQSNADVEIEAKRIAATFAGVLTEPSGSGGSLQGSIELGGPQAEEAARPWRLDIHSESLPLSVVSLIRRRFPESAASIPRTIHGDATGAVQLVGTPEGSIEATFRNLRVRNLTAADEGTRVWNNGLATLDGDLVLAGNRVIGRQLQATSDFATATIDGAFSRTFSLVGVNDNPLRWLEAIDGTATAEIDLAAFDRSLPGVLPLRDEAQLVSGKVVARIDSSPSDSVRRSHLVIRSDALRARARGPVVIDPIELTATVSSEHGQIRAEKFEWKSSFGTAIGKGDLRAGNADVEIDFGRLTAMLRPIVQISETTLAGAASGKIQWNASADNVWRLLGSGNVSNLLVTLPSGQSLKRPAMQGTIEAVGRWGGQTLDELTRADVTLASHGLDIQAELDRPVRQPSTSVPLPIRIRGNGRIETLAETLGPWLPPELRSAEGGFNMSARAEVSTKMTRLTSAAIELTAPRIVYADRFFSQPGVKVHFAGDYSWPSQDLIAESFTIAGDAFSMAAKGTAGSEQVDMQIKWRAKLERIQGSVKKRISNRLSAPIQQVGYRTEAPVKADDWLVMGDCEGEIYLKTRDNMLDIDTSVTGTNFAIIQPPRASAGFQTVGPMPPQRGTSPSPHSSRTARAVWAEPELKLDGLIHYDTNTGGVRADHLQVSGEWFASTLSGDVVWNGAEGNIELQGPARLQMDKVAHRLSSLAGIEIVATGTQETPLKVRVYRNPGNEVSLDVSANLGWESAQVAGLTLGPASVPIRLSETTVDVAPARIPVGQGHLNLAGQVFYRPGPLWLRINRGVIAESIQLTPEMTNRWLKYLAPLAADTTRIDGTIGAEIDEALIVLDQPQKSRVVGRLNVAGAEMTAGPMVNQILAGIDPLRTLAQAVSSPPAQPIQPLDRTLISMPAQTVGFSVEHGIVSHDRLFFEVGQVQVVTSGRVSLDGRLDMVAQVPLDASWLGSDLQQLAGQPVTLPIDGTLSQPSLDSSGVRQVATQLGVQAAQSTAENYLQKQLNRGFDKIFGR